MFTIDQIKTAHAKVKSGADFPAYVQELISIGLTGYVQYVHNGRTEYFGNNGFILKTGGKYPELEIADVSKEEDFKHYLKIHQQGQTDYLTFCKHSAETGIENWILDFSAMTCTYYDKFGNRIVEETIPQV